MPPIRRKPKSSTQTQPPLSFGPRPAKITKPSLLPPSSKPALASKQALSADISPPTADPSLKSVAADLSLEPPAASETKDEGKNSQAGEKVASGEKSTTGGKLAFREHRQGPRDEAEARAKRVREVDVRQYWRGKEEERKARRVHQNQLSLHEKILRHFDLSSQYGPCIGIPRLHRWKRAERLDLHPPIEVLAVLLTREEQERMKMKEGEGKREGEGEGEREGERAYVDELLRGGGGE